MLWIDAHADLNRPETSPSGNVHGMPLAAAFGVAGPAFVREALAERLGRARGAARRPLARRRASGRCSASSTLRVFTMSEIDRLGVERALLEALAFLDGAAFLHVERRPRRRRPDVRPRRRHAGRGGLSYREAHLALELVAESGRLDSLELVEVNPILDRENETAALAVELAASALGARIL